MKESSIPETLKNKFIHILRDHSLAKFGDTLTNFLYSLAKTKIQDEPIGIRVFDKALAETIRQTGLRGLMPSNSSAGDLGDGVEALIGYAYLNKIMSLDEMAIILINYLEKVDEDLLHDRKQERKLMTESFVKLIEEIINCILNEYHKGGNDNTTTNEKRD